MSEIADKLPITLTVIAHNEERNIRRCLAGAAPWCSEIVLVVNDCTDGTIDIAKEFDAKIFEESWHGHRDQKNIALSKATETWILSIDADEEVSAELAKSIRAFVQGDGNGQNAAYFPRKVWFLGRWITHGDWYPDHSLRLIKNGKGKWAGSREHDKMEVEGQATKLSGELLHYTCPSLNEHLLKIPYFSDIFLQRLLDKKAKWSAANAVFRAFWRFFRCYFVRLGFLDGYAGIYIAVFQGFSTLFRYSRLYEHKMQDVHQEKSGQ